MNHPFNYPYVLRTFHGYGVGHRFVVYPSLEAAIQAYAVTPISQLPRVMRDSTVLIEIDPFAFWRNLFHEEGLEQFFIAVAAVGYQVKDLRKVAS